MSDRKPNLEGPSRTGSPVGNETRLEATNSQIGNASQVVNSPGAVVNQSVTQVQPGTNATTIMLGGLGLLVALAFLPTARSSGAIGIFVAGGALAMIVFGFFSWVESLLKPGVKVEIEGWLVGVKIGKKVEPWPETFAKVFDRVFGEKYLSWKCFGGSALATLVNVAICAPLWQFLNPTFSILANRTTDAFTDAFTNLSVVSAFVILIDFVMLIKTRFALRLLKGSESVVKASALTIGDTFVGLFVGRIESFLIIWAVGQSYFGRRLSEVLLAEKGFIPVGLALTIGIYPALFTSIWLWLYAASGFLLKAAKRFDIGFRWFSGTFDIGKKPLQAIGFVAGALVALMLWGEAFGRWIVGHITHA